MVVIRHLIGMIYIFGILILAFESLYWLFHGFIPPLFSSIIAAPSSFVHECAAFLSQPVSWLLGLLISAVPFVSGFIPVTTTDIFQAEIHWAPLLSLFLYSGILRAFDTFVLKSKMNQIQNNYQNQQNEQPQPFNQPNSFNSKEF